MNRHPESACRAGTVQKIIVFQQNGSGESKIEGIRKYGKDRFDLKTFSIDEPLPDIIDDSDRYLPETIDADMVLDFLQHPDLSQDLGERCRELGIPVVASGKKNRIEGVIEPRPDAGFPGRFVWVATESSSALRNSRRGWKTAKSSTSRSCGEPPAGRPGMRFEASSVFPRRMPSFGSVWKLNSFVPPIPRVGTRCTGTVRSISPEKSISPR
jgi:hypothetical protein